MSRDWLPERLHGEDLASLLEINAERRRTHLWLLVFSVAYNALAVGLAVMGYVNPLVAAILMPASSLASLAIVGTGLRAAWDRPR